MVRMVRRLLLVLAACADREIRQTLESPAVMMAVRWSRWSSPGTRTAISTTNRGQRILLFAERHLANDNLPSTRSFVGG